MTVEELIIKLNLRNLFEIQDYEIAFKDFDDRNNNETIPFLDIEINDQTQQILLKTYKEIK